MITRRKNDFPPRKKSIVSGNALLLQMVLACIKGRSK